MNSEGKKKYRVQVLFFRSEDSDQNLLKQNVLLVHESEEKPLSKTDHIDTYLVVLAGDSITMLLRQTSDLLPIRCISGYSVSPKEAHPYSSFC